MPLSNIIQFVGGLYANRTVIHNADGTVAQFPTGPATAAPEIRKFDKSLPGAQFNNFQLSNPNPATATTVKFKSLRIESALLVDVYAQIVVAANPFDAPLVAASGVLDMFAVRALTSRTIETADFAPASIAVPANSEVYLRLSLTPFTFTDYTPTGEEAIAFTAVLTQA